MKIIKKYALILLLLIVLAVMIYIFILNNENSLKNVKTIIIDAGHGGDFNTLYTYSGDIYTENISNIIEINKSINGNERFFIEKDINNVNNKSNWLHYGDSGAVFNFNGTDVKEKDINLNIAIKLAYILERRFNVILTRNDDRYIFLDRRREIGLENNNSLFISIHQNSFNGSCVNLNRTKIYYNSAVAGKVSNKMLNALTREFNFSKGFVEQKKDFVVLNTQTNSLLVEINFICNEKNALLLYNEANQERIAQVIASSIDDKL